MSRGAFSHDPHDARHRPTISGIGLPACKVRHPGNHASPSDQVYPKHLIVGMPLHTASTSTSRTNAPTLNGVIT